MGGRLRKIEGAPVVQVLFVDVQVLPRGGRADIALVESFPRTALRGAMHEGAARVNDDWHALHDVPEMDMIEGRHVPFDSRCSLLESRPAFGRYSCQEPGLSSDGTN